MNSNRKRLAVAALVASMALFAAGGESDNWSNDIFAEGEFFVGCNYWAKNAGMYMWSQWDREVVEKELAALASNGVTVMRVFPLWSDFRRGSVKTDSIVLPPNEAAVFEVVAR